jgi:hypothetical protein
MATLPTRILEIEFDAGVWTDVTADLVAMSTRRGRNRELGAFETGTMNFALRNDTRKYDPDNAAGTYYGKLRPNRRVRLRATYNAVTYPIFQGYIDRISQQGAGPNAATAAFQASDMFKLLARTELPRSVYVAQVSTYSQSMAGVVTPPDIWWPLDEPSGSTAVVDIGVDKLRAPTFNSPTLGASGLVIRDPGSAMTVAGSLTTGQGAILERVTYPTKSISGTGAFTIEAWILCGNQTDNATIVYQGGPGDISTYIHFNVRGAGAFVGLLELRIGLINFAQSTVRVDDGAVHHVVGRRDGSGNLEVFVDGVNRTAAVSTITANIPNADLSIGATPWATLGLTGTIQHVAIWRTVGLNSATISDHNDAGRIPWRGQATGARLLKIYDLAAVPTADLATDAGSTTLQASSLGGSALAYAQKVEETEAGRLFVTRDGKIKFLSRYNGETGAYLTSKFTLADADSGVTFPPAVPYREGTGDADVDEATIVTRATVSREGSVAVAVFDAAAKTEFGWLDETHDGLLHDNDTYSKYYAEWVLNSRKTPSSRVGTVTVTPAIDPTTDWPALLGLEIAERITRKRKPQNSGAVTTQDMRVEAVSHELTGQDWAVSLQLSPFYLAGGVQTGVWDASLWDQAVWGL